MITLTYTYTYDLACLNDRFRPCKVPTSGDQSARLKVHGSNSTPTGYDVGLPVDFGYVIVA